MPLEIRELIIKATVNNNEGSTPVSSQGDQESNDAAINEIAERVFEIIKEKSER